MKSLKNFKPIKQDELSRAKGGRIPRANLGTGNPTGIDRTNGSQTGGIRR